MAHGQMCHASDHMAAASKQHAEQHGLAKQKP
jgi:hypothetical protein